MGVDNIVDCQLSIFPLISGVFMAFKQGLLRMIGGAIFAGGAYWFYKLQGKWSLLALIIIISGVEIQRLAQKKGL